MACSSAARQLPLRPLLSAASASASRISSRRENSSDFTTKQTHRNGFPVLFPRSNRSHISRYRDCGIRSVAKLESTTRLKDDDQLSKTWKIKMLYDGDCPLCLREVNMLKERNRHYGAIKFVDISSNDYSPEENEGLDYKTVMGRIHAVLSDGTVLKDVNAFRRLYEEVGLGWVYAITKYEPIATIVNALYSVWAKYRLQIVGRPSLEDILESRKKKMGVFGIIPDPSVFIRSSIFYIRRSGGMKDLGMILNLHFYANRNTEPPDYIGNRN